MDGWMDNGILSTQVADVSWLVE